jgi:plasmid segregation protein ParM
MSIILGIDHGNGAVKVYNGRDKVILPSAYARPEDFGEDAVGDGKLRIHTFESSKAEGELYCWGKDIREAKRLTPTYTAENRYIQKAYRILSEIIVAAMLPGEESASGITVVTGCPTREKDTDAEDQLKRVYIGPHAITVSGKAKTFTVDNVIVVPQPVATIMSMYYNDNGGAADASFKESYDAVIDIGSGTTDLDGIQSLRRMRDDSHTIELGMNDVYGKVARMINKEKPEANAQSYDVERQFASDTYVISKRASVDMRKYKSDALRELADDLIAEINRIWKKRNKFDRIWLTGGGAAIGEVAKYFRLWENDIQVVENSQVAAAVGLYRYGVFKAKQAQAQKA